jgi:BON domain
MPGARLILQCLAKDGGQRRMAHTLLSDFASQAKAVLGRSRIFDLRALEVEQEADCVVLRGSVDSFYHKQLAQELLKTAIDGVEVVNEIHVDYSREPPEDDRDWLW